MSLLFLFSVVFYSSLTYCTLTQKQLHSLSNVPFRGFHQLTHTQGHKLIHLEVFRGRLGFTLFSCSREPLHWLTSMYGVMPGGKTPLGELREGVSANHESCQLNTPRRQQPVSRGRKQVATNFINNGEYNQAT